MKRNVRLLFLVPFFMLLLYYPFTFAENDIVWDESFYERFTADTFKDYELSNQPIDFKNFNYPLLNAAIFYETNRMRIKYNREPFFYSRALEKAAFLHSKDMVERDFFGHENPFDAEKQTPSQRMALYGITEGYRAENVAIVFGIQYQPRSALIPPEDESKIFRDFKTGEIIKNHTYISFGEAVVEGFMQSTGHRANILDSNLRYLGCGAYHYENITFYSMDQFKVTQNFASVVPE